MVLKKNNNSFYLFEMQSGIVSRNYPFIEMLFTSLNKKMTQIKMDYCIKNTCNREPLEVISFHNIFLTFQLGKIEAE